MFYISFHYEFMNYKFSVELRELFTLHFYIKEFLRQM